jgi:hypothetical protein
MLAIEKEWESLDTRRGPSIESPHARDEIDRIAVARAKTLKENLSAEDMRQLVASSAALSSDPKKRGVFANEVLCWMIGFFLDSGDRDQLIKLLSTRFEQRLGLSYDIELALVGRGKRLKDPILILGEAYARCKDPDVRAEIAAAVRRAFTGSEIRGKDDAEFVMNSMQWYKKNRERLVVNPAYIANAVSIDGDYGTNPLFTLKKSAERRIKGTSPIK